MRTSPGETDKASEKVTRGFASSRALTDTTTAARNCGPEDHEMNGIIAQAQEGLCRRSLSKARVCRHGQAVTKACEDLRRMHVRFPTPRTLALHRRLMDRKEISPRKRRRV